jgi:ABC-type lipoprotein release transport system permease subunit
MLYSEIIAVCSEIYTKHINTLCGQNVELLNVKCDGTYSNHWALKYYLSTTVYMYKNIHILIYILIYIFLYVHIYIILSHTNYFCNGPLSHAFPTL